MQEDVADSPLATMRRRRPELFSDSEEAEESLIQRDVLDHYLDTLTKRKQEYQFEHFARLVAEQEICPNIRPQTGPTGGGDSKVDGETHPVAGEVSERWYYGDANAGSERWGFAFSAKQKWAPKVKSDVANIAKTDRGYTRIIFVTNQYAPDKKRAALEDELTSEHGIPVTILDRSWLIEKVSRSERSGRALEALGLVPPTRSSRRIGPNDAARLRDLEDLDAKIGNANRYRTSRYSLAEDMLNAALAARGLGRDRNELDGRFSRAAGIAEEVGSSDQRLRIAYLHAWTTFWWFEDRAAVDRMYERVEELAVASDHAGDLQKLVGLWQLLDRPSWKTDNPGRLTSDIRKARMVDALRAMANDGTRPNNAFQAEVSLAVIEIPAALRLGDPATLDAIWIRLASVVDRSANQLNFAIGSMFELVQELGEIVPDSEAFDDLMERFVDVIGRRRSEGAAGEANLKRALQKLGRGKAYDAIRILGRAELELAKQEHRELFVTTLVSLASAYQEAGLPWAARTKLLLATEQCLLLLRDRGDIEASLIRTLQRLVWAEIQLGRLPQTLIAWSYMRALWVQLESDEESGEQIAQDAGMQDAAIGLLILNAKLGQLEGITRLPAALAQLDLPFSRAAALWALGNEPFDAAASISEDVARDPDAFFVQWVEQPLAADLPDDIDLGTGGEVEMRSVVLGLQITLRAHRNAMSIAVGEAVLSALEAFFSTSLHREVMPWREEIVIEISPSGDDAKFSTVWTESDAELKAEVDHPPRASLDGELEREGFGLWLRDLIGDVIARTMIVPDARAWLDSVAREEQGFSRAISLGNVPILTESLYGDEPKLSIEDWTPTTLPTFHLQRTTPWHSRDGGARAVHGAIDGKGDRSSERIRHSDRRIASIINMPLWDRADWAGTGSMVSEPGGPLMLGLAFRDREAGTQIFEQWRARFGAVDEDEAIRVAIVLGINRRKPADYAVAIGSSFAREDRVAHGRHLVSFTRMQRMEPASRTNLDRFLDAFEREGAYMLAPMPRKAKLREADFRSDVAILKRELIVREAWEIGPHDPESVVIRPDDDPIVPTDGRAVPVKETLAVARQRASGSFMQR